MPAPSPLEGSEGVVAIDVKLEGSLVEDQLQILDCIVEQSSELPDSCTLRFVVSLFQDGGEDLLKNSKFPEGADIKVAVRYGSGPAGALFEGEITGVEYDITSLGPSTFVVKALHHAHRLMRGTRQLTFQDATDGDMFNKVVSGVGLTPNVKGGTPIVHPHTIQDNLTDWEFLHVLGRRMGARVSCAPDKTVVFDAAHTSEEAVARLEYGLDLISFRARTNGPGQVDSVEVRGWDVKTKDQIVGTANDNSLGVPEAGANVQKGKSGLPSAKRILTNQNVASTADAEALAKSTLRRIRGRFLQMEALCQGMAALAPGKMIEVENVGERFSGTYPITSAVHTIADGNYTTQVFSSGRDAEGLVHALGGGGEKHQGMGSGGFVVGIVTDNNDPEKMARVKVMYPALDDQQASHWARLVNPMGGSGRGMLIVPEIDDEVLVGFEQGNPNMPFILGGLWNGKDLPPDDMAKAVAGGKVERRMLKTRIGHTILLDDSQANQSVKITTKDGHYVLLDDKNSLLEVKDKTGQNYLQIDSANGNISIFANKNITIKSATGNIAIEATMGNVSTKATAGRVDTDAATGSTTKVMTTKVDLTPASVEASATAATLKGIAMTTIQGGIVKIN